MALGGVWTRVTSLITGAAIGGAAGDSVAPVLEAVKQHANAQRAIRVLDPGTAAELAAEHYSSKINLRDDAKRGGLGTARFDALVELESRAPGTAEALMLWRRGAIKREQVVKALHKAKVLGEYVEPILTLFNDRLDPAIIATAVQRGILPNADLLPVAPPAERGHVPPMPMVELDPIHEAQASGVNRDRLAVLTRIVGLPPGPGELLQLLNRGVITETDYRRGIAEGNTRNEWAPFLEHLRRRLLTPHEYAELRLRAWIDEGAMHSGAALSGMTPADTDLLHTLLGRPLSWHQVYIGLRRGGRYNVTPGDIDPAFLKSLQESDIRPEWYGLAWAQRYSYPSAFVLRQLTSSGELTTDETERILLYEGWEPGLARKVAHKWGGGIGGTAWHETRAELLAEYEGGYIAEAEFRAALAEHGLTGAAQDREVHLGDARRDKKYRDATIDAVARAYTAFKIGDTVAKSELAEVAVLGPAADRLLVLWQKQRRSTVALLTPPQVAKAYGKNLLSRADAMSELEDRGYSAHDAGLLLDES